VAEVPAALKTTVTELGASRVRLQVEIPAAELEGRVQRKARQLGRELKLPGFRRGKVPAPLVIQRIGRDTVLEQAVREQLPNWYSDAVQRAGIVPVGNPEVDLGELPPSGRPLQFSVEVGVVPTAELGDYEGLEVPRRDPAVGEEQIDAEVELVRERLARLETAERPAAAGDFVIIDYRGFLLDGAGAGEAQPQREDQPFRGGEGRDQLVELAAGKLLEGFEEGLIGASAGEQRSLSLSFPADYGNAELAGREASFDVEVKEVKSKQLPALDDELAVDVGFDDLEELRADIRRRLTEAEEARIEAEFREAALDAAVAGARVELGPELVKARAQEMWERMLHSLAHRGIAREAYLKVAGRSEEEAVAELENDAELALRREAVLTAIVAARGIAPSEEELLEALRPGAEREGVEPQALLERLRESGREEAVAEDLAARKAVDLIAESAKPISVAKAQARERLWTPAAGATAGEPSSGELWTPTQRT
jgi:trigger factor